MTDHPRRGWIAIAALTLAAGTASAQPVSAGVNTIKWDFNQFNWSSGKVALTADFTGTINFSFFSSATMQALEGNDTGLLAAYSVIGDPGDLSGIDGRLFLDNGLVTGGDFFWLNSDGDRGASYFAAAGRLVEAPGGYFSVSGLVDDAFLEDTAGSSTFGSTELDTIFGGPNESESQPLFGDFVFQRLQAGASFGTLDAEVALTLVPTPGTAALLGLGGLVATRRRR